MEDLKARIIRGGVAKVCAQAANLFLRVGSLMVLGRLLDPRSCTSSLRVIRSPANPVQYPFHHLCEGTLLWYPTSFSTSSR